MPSSSPDNWRADIEVTRKQLDRRKILSVSVVGTVQPDWTLDDLADDYAQCARWAVESGANAIETNFSCPNVCTRDGQMYQEHLAAKIVAERVREAIGNVPYIIKIGHVAEAGEAVGLLNAISPFANAIAMTNSIATSVVNESGEQLFNGERRGICGDATREASVAQLNLFHQLCRQGDTSNNHSGKPVRLIGVGGINSAEHVQQNLTAGAEAVQLATAAMLDPGIATRIRADFAGN